MYRTPLARFVDLRLLAIVLLTGGALAFGSDCLAATADPARGGPSPGGAGLLEFHQRHFPASERAGRAHVFVKRVGGRTGAVSVDYAATAGTATAGDDFTPTTGTFSWADGDRGVKSFTVTIVDDSVREGIETIRLALSNPTGGAQLGRLADAQVLILDNGQAPSPGGQIAFIQRAFEIDEGGGKAVIAVERRGGTTGAVAIDFDVERGTATPGEDYAPASGTLSWPDGEGGRKTFDVPILEDTLHEGREVALLRLSHPTGGAQLRREGADAALIIHDNDESCPTGDCDDGPGLFKFDEPTFAVAENAGHAVIVVERSGGSKGAVTVQYRVEGGTARAGEDFTPVSGTLSWTDGESTHQTFEVPILDDTLHEPAEAARLVLSTPTGGARLHPVWSRAALVIRASD